MEDCNMLDALTHGTSGLALSYASVEIPMLVSLIRRGVPLKKILQSPLVAIPLTAATGMALSAIAPLARAAGLTADSLFQIALGVGASAAVGLGGAWALAKQGFGGAAHRRGAVISPAPSRGMSRDRVATVEHGKYPEVTLAGIRVAAADETKHFKLIGTTGTGKSTAVQELLAGALARGDRAVIADPDYGYVRRFYDPRRGDVILNPFDSRACKWDLFGEITEAYDIDQLARSLIPDQGGADRSWREYARTFFTAVTQQ